MKTLYLQSKLLAVLVIVIICTKANSQSLEIAKSDKFQENLIEKLGKEKVKQNNNILYITISTDQIFEPNSSELKQEINTDIMNVINTLKKYNKYDFKVLVHTATEGADDINLIISQKRAETLTKYFKDNKLKSKRFKCIGIGETQSDQNSFNRVEFVIPYNGI